MIIIRYIYKDIVVVMSATLLIFMLVFLSTEFSHYLTAVAEGRLSVQVLFDLFLSNIPILLGMLLPMAFFVALLLVYGRLYAEYEMTILFASGFSQVKLLGYSLTLGCVLTTFTAWLSFSIIPQLNTYKTELLSHTAKRDVFAWLQSGHFQQSPDGKTIFYVKNISRDRKSFDNIFVAQRAKNNQWKMISAKDAKQSYNADKKGNFIIANDVWRYEGEAGKKEFSISHYGTITIRLPDDEDDESKRLRATEISALPTRILWLSATSNPQAEVELQWRISIPLQTLILTLLGVGLAPVRPRGRRYTPLFIGTLFYIIYANSLFAVRGWLDQGLLSLNLGLWWLHGILLMCAVYILANKPGARWLANLFKRIRPR